MQPDLTQMQVTSVPVGVEPEPSWFLRGPIYAGCEHHSNLGVLNGRWRDHPSQCLAFLSSLYPLIKTRDECWDTVGGQSLGGRWESDGRQFDLTAPFPHQTQGTPAVGLFWAQFVGNLPNLGRKSLLQAQELGGPICIMISTGYGCLSNWQGRE